MMKQQEISRPYEQLYISYIVHISSIPRILKQRPPLSESVNLVWRHQEWWQSLCKLYGYSDKVLQKTLCNYKRLAYNYMCILLFADDSLQELMFIVRNFSALTDKAICWLADLDDARWRAYFADHATQLSITEAKYRYFAAQRFLTLIQPLRPTPEEDYFEHYIWPRGIQLGEEKEVFKNEPHASAETTIITPPESPELPREPLRKAIKKTTSKSTRKKVKIPAKQRERKAATQAAEYDYEQIIAGLIKDGWLTKERTRFKRIATLMDCARFVNCVYHANQKRVFPEELIERLWKDYKIVPKNRLNEFLDSGSARWIANAQEWLK